MKEKTIRLEGLVGETYDAILQYDSVHKFGDSKEVLEVLTESFSGTIFDMMNALSQGRRRLKAAIPGEKKLGNEELMSLKGYWSESSVLDEIDPAIITNLAKQFVDSNMSGGSGYVLLNTKSIARPLAQRIVEELEERDIAYDILFEDDPLCVLLLNRYGEKAYDRLVMLADTLIAPTNRVIDLSTSGLAPDLLESMSPEMMKLFKKFDYVLSGSGRRGSGELFYTLTYIPTKEDAESDGFDDYMEYLELYLESCDQPWDEIGKANEHLIEKLDAAKEIHIQDENGTDVTFNVTGMTFANSLVAKNIPGSEVFSGPLIDGVNGTIVSKGKFQNKICRGIVEDVTYTFKDGKCVEAVAKEGQEYLDEVLAIEGADVVGELGIGTNPHLRQHLMNGLLVEKVSGSFHFALGQAYSYTEYAGKPVKLDNGNRSKVHRDMTTMLRGINSTMSVDGEVIQRNGEWMDPKLSVLNKGRGALSKDRHPERWKRKFPKGYQ